MNQLKTIVLLGGLSALLVAIGGTMGEGALIIATVMALVMNIGAYFYSDRLVLAMNHAQEVDPSAAPGLHRIVEDLAHRAGIPKPRVFLIHESQPNAFATGRNAEHGVVAVTQGLLDLLTEREIRGVLAHELAHIQNRDILIASVAAAIATAITSLAQMAQFSAIFGGRRDDDDGSPLATLAMALLAPLGATLVQMGISRSREFLADARGSEISEDPTALADALEKLQRGSQRYGFHGSPATASLFIVNPFTAGRMMANLFSTHPATEERVKRLRAMV